MRIAFCCFSKLKTPVDLYSHVCNMKKLRQNAKINCFFLCWYLGHRGLRYIIKRERGGEEEEVISTFKHQTNTLKHIAAKTIPQNALKSSYLFFIQHKQDQGTILGETVAKGWE